MTVAAFSTFTLCGGDFTRHPDTDSDCPARDKHTPVPDGYVDRAEWAGRMIARGALQCRCSTCGLYAIWTSPIRPMPDESVRRPSRRW